MQFQVKYHSCINFTHTYFKTSKYSFMNVSQENKMCSQQDKIHSLGKNSGLV